MGNCLIETRKCWKRLEKKLQDKTTRNRDFFTIYRGDSHIDLDIGFTNPQQELQWRGLAWRSVTIILPSILNCVTQLLSLFWIRMGQAGTTATVFNGRLLGQVGGGIVVLKNWGAATSPTTLLHLTLPYLMKGCRRSRTIIP